MCSLRRHTILPNRPSATRSTAATPKPCGQNAIEGRGRPSALKVSQHADPHFLIGAGGDGAADQVSYRTDATILLETQGKFDPFRNHHDREALAIAFALAHEVADIFDGERNFWDQDDVSAPCDAGLEGDPASVASHDFTSMIR